MYTMHKNDNFQLENCPSLYNLQDNKTTHGFMIMMRFIHVYNY